MLAVCSILSWRLNIMFALSYACSLDTVDAAFRILFKNHKVCDLNAANWHCEPDWTHLCSHIWIVIKSHKSLYIVKLILSITARGETVGAHTVERSAASLYIILFPSLLVQNIMCANLFALLQTVVTHSQWWNITKNIYHTCTFFSLSATLFFVCTKL